MLDIQEGGSNESPCTLLFCIWAGKPTVYLNPKPRPETPSPKHGAPNPKPATLNSGSVCEEDVGIWSEWASPSGCFRDL